ncbi:MAG: CHAD domain-containing protein [Janthinobacterium lividum]
MAFVNEYVKEIIELEVALFHARARLEATADDEALHDLRICIRRIRSLLSPLRSIAATNSLREAAAQVGRLTTPTRDLEVMAIELQARGMPAEAAARRARLQADYKAILDDAALKRLFVALDNWPSLFRAEDAGRDSAKLKRLIGRALTKQIDKLHAALNDPQFDRHELRILVKRSRYLTEAFPHLSPLSKNAAKSLKAVQAALGSWHDHFQWCLKAKEQADLQPLEQIWLQASVQELAQAEAEIKRLQRLLPDIRKKHRAAPVRQPAR